MGSASARVWDNENAVGAREPMLPWNFFMGGVNGLLFVRSRSIWSFKRVRVIRVSRYYFSLRVQRKKRKKGVHRLISLASLESSAC